MPFSLRPLALLSLFCSLLAASPLRTYAYKGNGTLTSKLTIMSGGLSREYYVYVPTSYQPGTPVPLVFNLHGYKCDAIDQLTRGDLTDIADSANFLIVLPNGTVGEDPYLSERCWNSFGTGSRVDDVGFISDLLTTLQSQYSIDATRVYSTGFSNGAFMSYRLACELNNRIAAIAAVSGAMVKSVYNNCSPQHLVPILDIHCTHDSTIYYTGGFNGYNADPNYYSTSKVLAHWVDVNGCDTQPVLVQLNANSTVERSVWSGGALDSTVVHYKVIGGKHDWLNNADINSSAIVWRFLRQFRLASPLPVTLTSFKATVTGPGVQLAWQTASEVHLDHFAVERSLDGRTFTALHTVAAVGNSTTTRSYGWLDTWAAAGEGATRYYRLRSVDQDGTKTYSPVQTVSLPSAAGKLAIFPNPAQEAVTLTGGSAGTLVQVFDAVGRLVVSTMADATGQAILSLPAGFPVGVYVVRTGSQAICLLRD